MMRAMIATIGILAAAGVMATPASAATSMSVNYTASPEGTPITIGGAAAPQYSFVLGTFFNGAAQYKIQGNDGATVAFPDNGVTQPFLSNVTTRLEGITFTEGDYQLSFMIGSLAYTGLATVVDQGRRISAISFSPVAGAVPEPATWAMMMLGMGAMGIMLRRRQRITMRVSYGA